MNAVVTIPMRTVSESNGREHWASKAKRVKQQRTASHLVTRQLLCPMPIEVTLTRVAPRALDDDNLRGCLKAVRDGVADAFGVNDNDPRVVWVYAQRRGKPREYAVEIHARSTRNTILPPVPELV